MTLNIVKMLLINTVMLFNRKHIQSLLLLEVIYELDFRKYCMLQYMIS